MRIGFFEIEPWEEKIIQRAFQKEKLVFSAKPFDRTSKDIEIISPFIYSKLNHEALAALPKLKMIATRSTGYDHIDMKECKKRGIVVCNVPSYGENTVAEHTFALILSLSRKIIDSVEHTKKGSFDLTGLRGFDLKSKTLGVIGTGKIGKHVIRIAKGFEMNVIAYDAFPNKQFQTQFDFTYDALAQVLKTSDILTLHVPYLPQTHHLLNAKAFALMKKGAYLINTSRGAIVDTDALVKALKSGKLAGAGLDVLEEENGILEEVQLLKQGNRNVLKTILEDNLLLKMPNVIVTPHNAFNTQEALMRILETTIENIKGFKEKKQVNVVSMN